MLSARHLNGQPGTDIQVNHTLADTGTIDEHGISSCKKNGKVIRRTGRVQKLRCTERYDRGTGKKREDSQ